MVLSAVCAIGCNSLYFTYLVYQLIPKIHLPFVNIHNSLTGNPFYSGIKSCHSKQIKGSILQTIWVLLQMTFVRRSYTGASCSGVVNMNPLPDIRTPYSGWPHQTFVACKTVNINFGLLHVKINRSCSLTSVNYKQNTLLPANFSNFC